MFTIYDEEVSCLKSFMYSCYFLLFSFSDVCFIFMWKVRFYIYSPISVRFSRRIESRFFAAKNQIQHANFSILQRYRFTTKIMKDLLNIVKEPSQTQVKTQIDDSKLKFFNKNAKNWDYTLLNFPDYQKLSVQDHSSILQFYYVEMGKRFSTGSSIFYFFVWIFQPVCLGFFSHSGYWGWILLLFSQASVLESAASNVLAWKCQSY